MSIFKKFWKRVICGFCLILLVSGIGIAYTRGMISPAAFANLWQKAQIMSLAGLNQSSSAQAILNGQKVSLKVYLNPKDKAAMEQFTGNLGVGEEWLSGVTFTLDEETAVALASYLPLQAKLQIKPDKIVFGEPDQYFSPEGTESAQEMVVSKLSDGGTLIDIKDPDQVLSQAVETKQVQISDNLANQGFWQLLSKIARIKIEIYGQKVNGEIDLRT